MKFAIDQLHRPLCERLDHLHHEIVDFRLHFSQALKNFQKKPVTVFVTQILRSISEEHSHYKDRILQCFLRHKLVKDRNKDTAPLTDRDKRCFSSLFRDIYGGCVHTKAKQEEINKVKAIGELVYEQQIFQHIRVGCVVDIIEDFVSLAKTSIRKILKELAPTTAIKYGRNSGDDKRLVKKFLMEQYPPTI